MDQMDTQTRLVSNFLDTWIIWTEYFSSSSSRVSKKEGALRKESYFAGIAELENTIDTKLTFTHYY